MCTSFIYRGNDTIVAMNFDNNGMKYSIDTSRDDWFTVMVDGGRGKYPSFGVSSEGVFFNKLVVDSNGKGLYKRPSKYVTHTSKLVSDILDGRLKIEDLDAYLSSIEVVNTPDWSCHCMICDSLGNTWVVEPGRGFVCNTYDDSKYFVMSNFSLIDQPRNCQCNRYETASEMLENMDSLDVSGAFEILKTVSQTSGEWITELSMVYSKNERAVYYCLNRQFDKLVKVLFRK